MKNRDQIFKFIEWGFFPLFYVLSPVVDATTVIMDRARNGNPIPAWEPFLWEFSSVLFILALIPFILLVDRRQPFQKDNWIKVIGMHVLLSIPFSLIHVGGMVGVRKFIYALNNRVYDFGNVPLELFYEYRKDILTYFFILAVIYGYRHFRFRYSEASLEGQTETGKPLKRVLIKSNGKETILKLDQIGRLEAAGNYVNIHAKDSRFFLRSTLGNLEGKLPKGKFVRVHRSNIVNLDHIREIIPTPSGDARIVMESGDHVSLSRRYRDRLKALEI